MSLIDLNMLNEVFTKTKEKPHEFPYVKGHWNFVFDYIGNPLSHAFIVQKLLLDINIGDSMKS